jgi:hypothetical protein
MGVDMSDLISVIQAQQAAKKAKKAFMELCGEKLAEGMTYDQVILVLKELKLIDDENIVRKDISTTFKDWVYTDIFSYNEPLTRIHDLLNAIEEYLNDHVFRWNDC